MKPYLFIPPLHKGISYREAAASGVQIDEYTECPECHICYKADDMKRNLIYPDTLYCEQCHNKLKQEHYNHPDFDGQPFDFKTKTMNKLSSTAQEYLDWVNYRKPSTWPTWVFAMKTAIEQANEKYLRGYLPHIVNAYHELKDHV